jgi:RHS repeat-associated protein
LFLILVLAFAVSFETRGQGLGAVLSSVQERHMAVHGTPVTWDEIPDGASNNEEFPTEEDVQSLGIEDRIRLLSKAVTVFRSVYGSYVNVNPDDLLAGENTGVAVLEPFTGVEFPPYGPIEPATYRSVLRQLALDVTRLRVLRATSLDCEIATTTDSYFIEEDWEFVNNVKVLVARDWNYNVVSSPVWSPSSVGIGSTATSGQPVPSTMADDAVDVVVNYSVQFDVDHPEVPMKTLDWTVSHRQVTAIEVEVPDYWPGGTAVALGRVAWSPWTGIAPLDVDDGAWRVIGSADAGESVEVSHEAATITVNGIWNDPLSDFREFVPAGFTFAKDSSGGSVGYDWKFRHQPGSVTVYKRDYAYLLVPAFQKGLDTSAAKTALAKLRKVTPQGSIDGRALPRPMPGMIVGINLGPGLEDGTSGAWLGVVPSHSKHWFGEYAIDPLGLGISALPSSWGGWRFDCAPALRFIGPHADFHVVYETTRDPETKPWNLPSCNFGNAGFRQRGWDGVDSFVKAWDSPQIRQVVGRHVLVDVEFGDGFSQTVSIYRRDGSVPDLAPGDLVDTEGLALIRKMMIGNPNTPAAMTGFGSGADHVRVTDQTAGTTLDVSLSSVSNYWGDIELKVTNTSDQSELWKEVWDSSSTVTGVNDVNWFAAAAPNYTVTSTLDGNAQTAVAVTGLPGPFHVWPEKPASLTAGNLTVTWQKETLPGNTAAEKWTTSITGEPDLVEIWRNISNPGPDSGSPPRIPLSVARGGWSNLYILPEDSRILEVRTLLGTERTGTEWIEWTDNGAGGDSVTIHSAPDGIVTAMGHESVSMTRYDFGGLNGAAEALPWALHRTDWGDGGGLIVKRIVTEQGGIQTTADRGRFASEAQSAIDRGERQQMAIDRTGFPVTASKSLIHGTSELPILSAAWDQATRTAWGEPIRITTQPGGLVEQWSYIAEQNGSETDNLNLRSWTSPLGLDVRFDPPDPLGRATGGEWNGTGFGIERQPGDTGADLTWGTGVGQVKRSWRSDLLGRFVSSGSQAGGRTASHELARAVDGSRTLNLDDGFGRTSQTSFLPNGGLDQAQGNVLPFGGTEGDPLSVVDGLVVARSEIADAPGTYAAIHTDAFGRVRKIVTPSKSGGDPVATTITHSPPNSSLRRVITTEPTGRIFITETDPFDGGGALNRSGIDVTGNGSLGASDRYTQSITIVDDNKVVTTLSVTAEDGPGVVGGIREILKSEWTPSSGITVTTINGGEETITTEPKWSEKRVTTSSSKGWTRHTDLNQLGLADENNLSGTGLPTTKLDPEWRADGSLWKVSLKIGDDEHIATFNHDGTLASLIVPNQGEILENHEIDDDGETLSIAGTTIHRSHDGTSAETVTDRDEENDLAGYTESLSTALGGFKQTIDPIGGAATHTNFNHALAPTSKTYADNSGETHSYDGELLKSVSLARGGQLEFGYSGDGAQDLTSSIWPTITSGPFTISELAHEFTYNRSGQIKTLTDPSGSRTLGYENGRLVSTAYTAGLLRGHEVIRAHDTIGRNTGSTLKRDGAIIHSVGKAPNGASDQITSLASGSVKVVPLRDNAGHIRGFQWGNATGNFVPALTQTWERGAGGRIEYAGSDVPGAPYFDYLLDSNDPGESFDSRGRRLKCETAGGTWTYTYGLNGQLTRAIHEDASDQVILGDFRYAFDAIGRRSDKGTTNTTSILNQTTAWTNSQSKKLTITAQPGASVWFNGEEVSGFAGSHQVTLGTPGATGQWIEWNTLAILAGQGEGAGSPPANPLASPDAKAEKHGATWIPPAQETLAYDDAGNRQGNSLWDYGWDAKNQLVRARTKDYATAPQGWDIRFTYDAEGRRVRKHVIELREGERFAEKEITFIWDGWDLLYERHQLPSGLTTLERKYLWGPDIADGAAGGAGGLLLIRETKGNTTTDLIPLSDGTGHVVALTNLNKDLLATYAYGPFGEKISATGPNANTNPWRWGTKYLDEETGLYYFGHRYYDPITGQFLSREPLGESESVNLYSYCGNDPVNHVDVLGLKKFPILNPTNPFVMKDGAWHRNEIFVHAADWFWQTSQGILPGTERIGRKAGPLDFAGWQLDGGTWRPTAANAGLAKAFADKGWDLDSGAELTGIAGGSMTALVTGPMAIASTITAAPALYTAGCVKATGASVAIQSSPWGVPIVGGALTSGAMLIDGEDPGTAITSGGMQVLTGRAMSAPINWSAMRPANWMPQNLFPSYGGRPGFLPGMVINPFGQSAPTPNTLTGQGYGVNDPAVRVVGTWTTADFMAALRGRPPGSLGRPDLHHAGQMPGSAIHEILPRLHQGNRALHPNKFNQGVTPEMRREDRRLHWWYRAREEGADKLFPDLIYDP